jgi:hypothetical protein
VTFVFRLLQIAFLILLLTLPVQAVQARGVVGDGTPASCTEAALDTALLSGGMITFDCGATPHTIYITGTKDITHNTIINGDGLITLDARHWVGILRVHPRVHLTVRGLTIMQGAANVGAGIYNDQGVLQVRDSTFYFNRAILRGGGIYNDGGRVTVRNSTFAQNLATSAGFEGDPGTGGGIYNTAEGWLMIYNSTFSRHQARASGGVLVNEGRLFIYDSVFTGNMGVAGAGGVLRNLGDAVIYNSTMAGNSNNNGGAITNAGTLAIYASTISDNTGYVIGGGINNSAGYLFMLNSTVSGNLSQYVGGGLHNTANATAQIVFSTFYNNQASTGGGIYNDNGQINITRSIVGNSTGGDCVNAGGWISGSENLATGACPAYAAATGVDPVLADNGGPTQTHALLSGSNAINAVRFCFGVRVDQRGVRRTGRCDIGAYEYR